jgi:hypothetical protein
LTDWDPKGSLARIGKEAEMKNGQIVARFEGLSFRFGGFASFMGRYA